MFAMLNDDPGFLRDKLLAWLGPVPRSRKFPGGGDLIGAAYSIVRPETMSRLDPASADLLEPYFDTALGMLTEGSPAA